MSNLIISYQCGDNDAASLVSPNQNQRMKCKFSHNKISMATIMIMVMSNNEADDNDVVKS